MTPDQVAATWAAFGLGVLTLGWGFAVADYRPSRYGRLLGAILLLAVAARVVPEMW